MFVDENETCKGVNGFTNLEIQMMKSFLQGAVYCWCKNRPDEWFAARDLLGGENYFWEGTPLYRLYEVYYNEGENEQEYAISEAGKAAGRLLKIVLLEDKREFECHKGYNAKSYRWTGFEDNHL